jgi:K+/H+ antiporter YhaU regulatory subunit KhtT
VAVRRDGQLLDPPDPDEKLAVDDLVYLVGATRSVGKACTLLTRGADDAA